MQNHIVYIISQFIIIKINNIVIYINIMTIIMTYKIMTITSLSARKFSLSSKLQVLFLCQLLGPFQLYNDIRFNIADVENTCNFVVLLTPVFSSTYVFTVDRTKVTMSFESYNRSEKMQQSRLRLSKSVLITSVFPSTRKARTK